MSNRVAKYLLGMREAMTGKGARRAGMGRSLGAIDLSIHREVLSRREPLSAARRQTRTGHPMSRDVTGEPVLYAGSPISVRAEPGYATHLPL